MPALKRLERQVDLEAYDLKPDSLVLEVVIVSDKKDRLKTVIKPDGLKNWSTTVLDYNHSQLDTGAKLLEIKTVEKYQKKDGEVLNNPLIGYIEVPKTAIMPYKDNNGVEQNAGSLYDAIVEGRIKSVSVMFLPDEEMIATTDNGIVFYLEWELPYLSFLTTAPGQGSSEINRLRALGLENTTNNQKIMPKYQANQQLEAKITILEVMGGEEPEYKVSISGVESTVPESDIDKMLQNGAEVEDMDTEKPPTPPMDEDPERGNKMPKERDMMAEIDALAQTVQSLADMVASLQNQNKQTPEPTSNPEPNPERAEEMESENLRQLSKLVLANPNLINQIENVEIKAKLERSLKMTQAPVKTQEEVQTENLPAGDKTRSLDELKLKYNPHL